MTLGEQLGFFLLFFFSVVFRELARGYIATFFGDTTPYNAGRLTVNPIAHIDVFGTIVLPILFVLFNVPAIGWAKPMPIHLGIFKSRITKIMVAVSGIIANIFLIVFSLTMMWFFSHIVSGASFVTQSFALLAYMNIILVIFHIIPIPPLDGFVMLTEIPNTSIQKFVQFVARMNPLLLFLVILIIWNILYPVVEFLYAILVS